MSAYETIIIGCGISGIACARRLAEAGRDFLVLTEDVGGRMLSSPSGEHNYGALFVLDASEHVRQVVSLTRRLRTTRIQFHWSGRAYVLAHILRRPMQVLRFLGLLKSFRERYVGFRRSALVLGQRRALHDDPTLLELYQMPAEELLVRKGVEGIGRKFFGEVAYACMFLPLSRISAFDFLRISLSFIVPTSEFRFHREDAVAPFAQRIVRERVTAIDERRVETASGKSYLADHVVVATPPQVARDLLGLEIKAPSRVTMRHVRGEALERCGNGLLDAFDSASPLAALFRYEDGTYLVVSTHAEIDLDDYFAKHEVLFEKIWDPAFNVAGDVLLEQDLGDGLYCISDINVVGLEECYINGLWAAQQILARA